MHINNYEIFNHQFSTVLIEIYDSIRIWNDEIDAHILFNKFDSCFSFGEIKIQQNEEITNEKIYMFAFLRSP